MVKILKIRILWNNQKFINMKTTLRTLLILLFLGVSFSGCEQIKGLADHTFDVDLEGNLDVVVPNEGQLKSSEVAIHFESEVNIDPKSNEDIYDYWDEIKSWAIKGVKLEVINSGGVTTELTNVKVTVKGGGETALFNVGTWTMKQDATYALTDTDGNYQKLANMLGNEMPFSVKFEGDCNLPSIHFMIKYMQTVEVTANPL